MPTKPRPGESLLDARRRLERELGADLPTVAAMWRDYQARALPADAPQLQVLAFRIAFVAGVAAMFDALYWGIGNPGVEREAGRNYLAGIAAELQAFAAIDGPRRV